MTGTLSSRARALSPREISDTSWTRFESRFCDVACMSWR